jgi:tRNA A37 threonylcarbamoyladenosine dehydratase
MIVTRNKINKHTFGVELGIDVYSSASSDKIDPTTISSASSKDVRISPSLNYLKENAKNNTALGGGVSFSQEFGIVFSCENFLF